jgi:breast cancer 2 susceptibility protein
MYAYVTDISNVTRRVLLSSSTNAWNSSRRYGLWFFLRPVNLQTQSISLLVDSVRLPDRKRQRLSSPTYDEQLPNVSQDDLAAFDEIEARLSQCTQSPSKRSLKEVHRVVGGVSVRNDTSKEADKENIAFQQSDNTHMDAAPTNPVSHSDDSFFKSTGTPINLDTPFASEKPTFTSANFATSNMLLEDTFASPAALPHTSSNSDSLRESPRSPSPVIPPERDYSSWFESAPALPAVGFQTAKFVSSSLSQDQTVGVHTTGFMKASNTGWIAPSAEALAKAEEKIKTWQEGDTGPVVSSIEQVHDISAKPSVNSNLSRPVLGAVENSFNFAHLPDSPSPANFGRPSNAQSSTSSFSAAPSQIKGKVQPFKSPLMQRSSRPPVMNSPEFNPLAIGSTDSPSASHGRPHTAFHTPVRPSGLGGRGFRNTVAKPRFITPFKEGMRPGDPGRKLVVGVHDKQTAPVKLPVPSNAIVTPSEATPTKSKGKQKVFDLCKRSLTLLW